MYYNNYTYPNYTQYSNNNTNLIFVNGLDNAIHKEGENTRALITDSNNRKCKSKHAMVL